MTPRKDWDKLTAKQITDEIIERWRMIDRELVGQLYPSILRGEIEDLSKLRGVKE